MGLPPSDNRYAKAENALMTPISDSHPPACSLRVSGGEVVPRSRRAAVAGLVTVPDRAAADTFDSGDITRSGGLSPYGTMAQGGNVWKWEETENNLVNDAGSAARGMCPRMMRSPADDR